MIRLIPILAIIALSAGCKTRQPSIASGPVSITGFDANGHQTITSYAGRTAAGQGMVNDTTEAEIVKALALKLDGKDFTYASATRSAVTQPDTVLDSKIEEAHKAALSDAGAALAAGASGNYAKAIAEAASLGGQLIAARTARANAPKPDSGAIRTRILSSGEGHAQAAQVGILTFGQTLQAAKRATYAGTSESKSTDTTAPGDWEALAKILAELKKPILPPVAAPVEEPIIFPPFGPPATGTSTNIITTIPPTVETITLPELPK